MSIWVRCVKIFIKRIMSLKATWDIMITVFTMLGISWILGYLHISILNCSQNEIL